MAHTQNSITVYLTNDEKNQISDFANISNKSMSRYLLDLGMHCNPSTMTISSNDHAKLYGAVHAAFNRLKEIKVSEDRMCHAVEKDQVLRLLEDAKELVG